MSKDDILFIYSCKGDKSLGIDYAFFPQDFFVCSVCVDDNCFRQKYGQFFASGHIALDDLNCDVHIYKLRCQIICRLSAAYYYGVPYGVVPKTRIFHEFGDASSGSDDRYGISCQYSELSGRNIYITVTFYGTYQNGFGILAA